MENKLWVARIFEKGGIQRSAFLVYAENVTEAALKIEDENNRLVKDGPGIFACITDNLLLEPAELERGLMEI